MTAPTMNALGKRSPAGTVPLLRLGFRPFYLLAAAFAAVGIPIWLAQAFGWLPAPGYLHGMQWHAHEMIYGFASAVIVGFLFTAARNWTGLPTPTGGRLAALALLWLAGRVTVYTGPAILGATLDVLFLPCAAYAVFSVLKRSGNTRNYPLVGILALLATVNAGFHIAAAGLVAVSPDKFLQFALVAVVMIATIIGGRVIPSFTAAAVAGARPVIDPRIERAALFLPPVAFLLYLVEFAPRVTAAFAAAAALVHLIRLAGWQPLITRRAPILWILHVSYAWIPVGLALLAAAAVGRVSPLAVWHALGMGAISGLIIGMVTRTALGHTGRPLRAGRAETTAYLLVHAAALVRVLALTALPPGFYGAALVVSGALFSLAFALYLTVYGPYLTRPRVDGKDG